MQLNQNEINANMAMQQQQPIRIQGQPINIQGQPIRVQEQNHQPHPPTPTRLPNNVLQHRHNAPTPMPIRRQDLLSDVLPSAAVGALASGLTPISIFSNLLNAYATLDNKHDITGKYLLMV